MQEMLAPDASVSYRGGLIGQIKDNRNLRHILKARCTGIGEEVVYEDAENNEHRLAAGTVVIAAGMRSRQDEAMYLWNIAERFVMIGDCAEVGKVEKAMRTGFSAAVVL